MATTEPLPGYEFPSGKLAKLKDANKIPLVLVACGSFSPITNLHLRMFEMIRDHVRFQATNFEVVGGMFSPVGDAYKKAGLAPGEDRLNMCKLATSNSSWIAVDDYEVLNTAYVPTANVLDHFDHEINAKLGGVECENGEKKRCQVSLIAGADLIETMSAPGVWAEKDLDRILSRDVFIVERSGTDTSAALKSLERWRERIYVVQQLVSNDISSTKIRLFLKRDMSIRWLVPDAVEAYIQEHGLFRDESADKE
ncbi:Nucleotidylyl transferase [Aulographum hederae CBS 113979]|uniref:Nicotinamide-nucleotide adenylyltransferase n=1 Tax=Aulographum hederae CBS 113979 TaxID=1176131 RepID=A0A6G1GVU3_9PEZI|nr:Nucleotidylyl transferase [Aulographum hederae CBS 113979]